MSAVKGRDTGPEIRVRKALHAMGYRFRLHRSDLPGKPDIVLPKYRLCIFVHGCFWHQHPGCHRATVPATDTARWLKKFEDNRVRDLKGTLKNSRCLCRTRKPRYVRVRNSMIIKAFEKRDL